MAHSMGRNPQTMHRERFFHAFLQAAGGARIQFHRLPMQSFQRTFGVGVFALTGQVLIYNSSTDDGPTSFDLDGGIYTWDDATTAKRGAGGNPTTVCQGYTP